jgi:hypothetical protein
VSRPIERPTLEWESLPKLGADRSVFRARVWRLILAGLLALWGGVIGFILNGVM